MKKVYRFTMPNMASSLAMKTYLDKNNVVPDDVDIETVDLFSEEGRELAQKYNVRAAPTMIHITESGSQKVFRGFTENSSPERLREWLEGL